MRRSLFSVYPFAFLGALALCSCDPSGAPPPGPGGAPRVVSLSPSITDILVSLGAESQIVGTCAVSGRPNETRAIPTVASFGTVDLERVVALRPTLCATAMGMQDPQALADLHRAGVPVVQYRMESLEDLWTCVADLGARVGKEARGSELAASYRARVESVRRDASAQPPRALLLVGDDPAVVAGEGTFLDEILRAAGFSNAAAPRRGYPQMDLEGLALTKPDFLIFPEGDIASASAGALADRVMRITAVRPDPIGVHADILVRPGPQTAVAVELLAKARRSLPAPGAAARAAGSP